MCTFNRCGFLIQMFIFLCCVWYFNKSFQNVTMIAHTSVIVDTLIQGCTRIANLQSHSRLLVDCFLLTHRLKKKGRQIAWPAVAIRNKHIKAVLGFVIIVYSLFQISTHLSRTRPQYHCPPILSSHWFHVVFFFGRSVGCVFKQQREVSCCAFSLVKNQACLKLFGGWIWSGRQ